jgi:hypothetical protein
MAIIPLLKQLSVTEIEKMASRSNFRFGKQLLKDAKINVQTNNVFRRIATVSYKNHPEQKVEFLSDHKGLHYKCSCSNRKNMFCEHCIAVALGMHEQE